ncbi:hypothetical protein PUNSTDRAFT_119094 [Punctularia strigosozonata HHB-11173 SS5]|uniref:uncharacterized protein n=1 Tax=Punctularia strigosozonata (strain HHB-11173) TaxID=741275 RepID=UPI0004417033|nr:uncharacterized protein PUNSTDRAFT_119094 [Punctularia strigosozonata HHB-11173 SS5]EIN11883.1 hypothetical protein PUNSTDRAFT_119094 [Punctularia strigosozonata HHB-11173 SS5]
MTLPLPDTTQTIRSYIHYIHPVGEDGQIRCYKHNVVSPPRTVQSGPNEGRKFYTCYKDRSDPGHCGFFLWADEPALKQQPRGTLVYPPTPKATPSPPPPLTPSSSPAVPTSFAEMRSNRATPTGPANPPATPQSLKRPRHPSSPSSSQNPPPMTPEKQRRLAAIQAALSESQERAGTHAYMPSSPISSRYGASQSQTEDESQSYDMPPPTKLFPSNASSSKHSKASYSKVGGKFNDDIDEGDSEDEFWLAVSRDPILSDDSQGTSNPSPAKRHKPDPASAKMSGWNRIQSDPENPFHVRSAALRASTSASSTPRQQTQSSPQNEATPVVAQVPTPAPSDDVSATSISTLVAQLSSVPAYVSKLERRLAAAEKSNIAKLDRIKELEIQLGNAEARCRYLEESNAALAARHPGTPRKP